MGEAGGIFEVAHQRGAVAPLRCRSGLLGAAGAGGQAKSEDGEGKGQAHGLGPA